MQGSVSAARRWSRPAFALGAVVLISLAVRAWKAGTPYGELMWSPNHQYYVRKYENRSARCGSAGPGQGSDAKGGYVRLFDRDDQLLQERYVPFSRDVEPVWSQDRVYLLGFAEMDDAPWVLPGSAE
jgi:hypothetical protein